MRKTYPSEITREQFEGIRPILESIRKKTKPRALDLYDVFNAVLYVLKTGCQWSALPHDYPKYRTVHSYFMKWSEQERIQRNIQPSMLEEVLKKIHWRGPYTQWTERTHKHGHR
jgi:transposase